MYTACVFENGHLVAPTGQCYRWGTRNQPSMLVFPIFKDSIKKTLDTAKIVLENFPGGGATKNIT